MTAFTEKYSEPKNFFFLNSVQQFVSAEGSTRLLPEQLLEQCTIFNTEHSPTIGETKPEPRVCNNKIHLTSVIEIFLVV